MMNKTNRKEEENKVVIYKRMKRRSRNNYQWIRQSRIKDEENDVTVTPVYNLIETTYLCVKAWDQPALAS